MKAKVSASWCNLYYTHSTVIYKYIFFVLFNYKFLKLGGIWKRQKTKKDIHRLSNFYNWWFICILYPWSFLYWKLKEKKSILGGGEKKKKIVWPINVALPWPGLESGLLLVSSNFFIFFFSFFSLAFATKWCLIFDLLYPPVSLTSWISFRGGGGVRIL